jgi:prevent-host-death family protein
MRDTYSLYEAKAKLSAIIRKVREGRAAVITLHGEPVAEIHPVAAQSVALRARMEQLAERGIVVRTSVKSVAHPSLPKKPGALKRFLDDRD